MRIRAAVLSVVLALTLTGCATTSVKATEAPIPSDATLDRAVGFMNDVDTFIDQTESGAPGLAFDTLDSIDAQLENFGKGPVSKEMPAFYDAALGWRAALDKALEADDGVMADRALDDLNAAKSALRAEVDRALDAAGK